MRRLQEGVFDDAVGGGREEEARHLTLMHESTSVLLSSALSSSSSDLFLFPLLASSSCPPSSSAASCDNPAPYLVDHLPALLFPSANAPPPPLLVSLCSRWYDAVDDGRVHMTGLTYISTSMSISQTTFAKSSIITFVAFGKPNPTNPLLTDGGGQRKHRESTQPQKMTSP